MKVFTLHRELWLPRPREDLFRFFADAFNLERITPPFLHFRVITPRPIEMKAGTLIDYRLRLHGFPLGWRTLIRLWEPPFRFQDVQIKGPYSLWEHTHVFEEKEGGTSCLDEVRYGMIGGPLVNRLLVRRNLERIFDYRNQKLSEFFGGSQGP
ncbi:MAG: hypothetical protein GMKNLPBB_02603 [Myxococcota bacterium]|nr:hypothetical protein [Myxococcota bacterium]